MVCSTPGFPVLHHLPEFAQTHVHCGEGNGNPLQYSCLENPRDRGSLVGCHLWGHTVGHDWSDLAAASSMSNESVMPSNHLVLCHPLLLLPSIFPSIRIFSSELDLRIKWPNYWSFSSSFSPSNEYSGLISFRMDWFDLLASKGLSRVFSRLVGSLWSPRDSQESSPAPQFQSISSSALSLLYGPTLTSIHDY